MDKKKRVIDGEFNAEAFIEGSRTILDKPPASDRSQEPPHEPVDDDVPPPESVQAQPPQQEPMAMGIATPTPKRQEHREPSGRKRGVPSYRELFVVRNGIKHRQCVYISHEVHSLISSLVRMLVDGGGEITVGGYIDKVLYEHLQAYKNEINELYRNSRQELLK